MDDFFERETTDGDCPVCGAPSNQKCRAGLTGRLLTVRHADYRPAGAPIATREDYERGRNRAKPYASGPARRSKTEVGKPAPLKVGAGLPKKAL